MLDLRKRRRTLTNHKAALGGFALAFGFLGSYSSLSMLQVTRRGAADSPYLSRWEASTDPRGVGIADTEIVVSSARQNTGSAANPQAVSAPVQSAGLAAVQPTAPASRPTASSGAVSHHPVASPSPVTPPSGILSVDVPAPGPSPTVEPAEAPPSFPVVVIEPSPPEPIDVVVVPEPTALPPVESPAPTEEVPPTPPDSVPDPADILQPTSTPGPAATLPRLEDEPVIDGVTPSTP